MLPDDENIERGSDLYMISDSSLNMKAISENELPLMKKSIEADITVNQDITIDTDRMIAYNSEMTNQSTLVSGYYEDLYLQEGQNEISITSGFNLTVIPNWRTL